MLGLTFKPNTDEMRDAPSLSLIAALQDGGARVRAYDPEGAEAGRLMEGVSFAPDPYGCAEGADALVIVTEWDVFRALDLGRIREVMRAPVLVDLRNIYPPEEVARYGFTHAAIGQPSAVAAAQAPP